MGELKARIASIFKDQGRPELQIRDLFNEYRKKYGPQYDLRLEMRKMGLEEFLTCDCALSIRKTYRGQFVSLGSIPGYEEILEEIVRNGDTGNGERKMRPPPGFKVDPNFKNFLRTLIERAYKERDPNEDSIGMTVGEFVDYFNDYNRRQNRREFFCSLPYPEYFSILTDVCQVVEREGRTFIFPTRFNVPVANRDSRLDISRVGSGRLARSLSRRRSGCSPERNVRQESIRYSSSTASSTASTEGISCKSEAIQVDLCDTIAAMMHFNESLAGRSLTLESYLKELQAEEPAAHTALCRSQPEFYRQLEFITERTRGLLSIKFIEGKLVFERPPPIVKEKPLRNDDVSSYSLLFPHSSAFKVRLLDLEVPYYIRPFTVKSGLKMQVDFRLAEDMASLNKLRVELRNFYSNRGPSDQPLYQGQPVALPLHGTDDYHRGSIVEILDERFARVCYVDICTYEKVAIPSLRPLDVRHLADPVFLYEARMGLDYVKSLNVESARLEEFIRSQKEIKVKFQSYLKKKKYYVMRLDQDIPTSF